MAHGTDVQLALSDNELEFNDHRLQTASFSSHNLEYLRQAYFRHDAETSNGCLWQVLITMR